MLGMSHRQEHGSMGAQPAQKNVSPVFALHRWRGPQNGLWAPKCQQHCCAAPLNPSKPLLLWLPHDSEEEKGKKRNCYSNSWASWRHSFLLDHFCRAVGHILFIREQLFQRLYTAYPGLTIQYHQCDRWMLFVGHRSILFYSKWAFSYMHGNRHLLKYLLNIICPLHFLY